MLIMYAFVVVLFPVQKTSNSIDHMNKMSATFLLLWLFCRAYATRAFFSAVETTKSVSIFIYLFPFEFMCVFRCIGKELSADDTHIHDFFPQ